MLTFLKLAFSVVPDYVIVVELNIIKYKNLANVLTLQTRRQLESLGFEFQISLVQEHLTLFHLKFSLYRITHCSCITGVFGL